MQRGKHEGQSEWKRRKNCHHNIFKTKWKYAFGLCDLWDIVLVSDWWKIEKQQYKKDLNSLNSSTENKLFVGLAVIGSHTSLRENKFGSQHCNHLNFVGLHGKQAKPGRCKPPSVDRAKNQKGNFTHPADSAVLLLIAGWSSNLSPRCWEEKPSLLVSQEPEPNSKGKLWLMKRRKKRQIRVCPRYNICCVTLFSLTELKLTEWISYTGSAEMWTRFSFWRVPVSARFQGITAARACLLIYCAKHRFVSETAGYI